MCEPASSTGREGFARATARAVDVVERLCPRYGITGAVVALASDSLTWMAPWGTVLTPSGRESARSDHRFLLTSVCKVVAAAHALSFVDSGLVAVDEPVQALVPAFGCHGKEQVTITHILTHTSGVRSARPTPRSNSTGLEASDHLRYALNAKTSWAPGTHVEYSSSPFWALAAMCSAGSKEAYTEQLSTWAQGHG